ncbi:MAG: hypothetical protein IJ196_08015 [Prevotella sp.]|nr:hypothetical protein [Prevotella sp.]
MNYDQEILGILAEAGEKGLSVQKISMHVFNACNSLFHVINPDDVHDYVARYLSKNSRNPNSIVERAEPRGIYRINPNSDDARQLMLQFKDEKPAEGQDSQTEELSLPLF